MIDAIRETTENKIKEQKFGFLGMLLETLGVSMLDNTLIGKRSNECWKMDNESRKMSRKRIVRKETWPKLNHTGQNL